MGIKASMKRTLHMFGVFVAMLSLLLTGFTTITPAQSANAAPVAASTSSAPTNAVPTNTFPTNTLPNPQVCKPNTVYGILVNGQLREVNTASGVSRPFGSANIVDGYPLRNYTTMWNNSRIAKEAANGLAVSADGQSFYAFRTWSRVPGNSNLNPNSLSRSSFDVFEYDANGSNPRRLNMTENGRDYAPFWELGRDIQNMDLIAGAVNPADGRYYFGGFHQQRRANSNVHELYFALRSVDPRDGRLRHVAYIYVEEKEGQYALDDANGDFVYDLEGNFHLIHATRPNNGYSQVKIVTLPADVFPEGRRDIDMPIVRGTETVTRSIDARDGTANSLAMDSDGSLVIGTTTTAFSYDPTSWRLIKRANQIHGGGNNFNTDFGSCHFPPTLEIKKDIVERADASDQFTLTADDQSPQGIFARTTTQGTAKGVQERQIGPALVLAEQEYLINETMARGSASSLNDYSTTLQCEASYANGKTEKITPVKKTGQQYGVTIPKTGADGPAHVSCTYTNDPVEPEFAVKKEAAGATLEGENGFVSKYKVTVTNTGDVKGTSAKVIDKPEFAPGFTPETIQVDGTNVALRNGEFAVTDGVALEPGKSKTFDIAIKGTYTDSADWEKAGECEVDGGLAPGQGLFNKVTMEGDSDGEENNEACNPLTTDPAFAVKKDSAEAGATAADGEWTSAYTVTVTNTGKIAGTSAEVVDIPTVPAGFTMTGATVNGEKATIEDGKFIVTDGAKLATGKSETFEVVLSGTYEAAEADWAAAAECEIEGEGDPSKGFFNRVTMEGDSDGPKNNDACNTVEKDPAFAVKKEASGAELTDDGFVSKYEVTVTNTGEVTGKSAQVTDTTDFAEGFTPETALVDGDEVDLKDGSFTVTDGVELKPGDSKTFEIEIRGLIAEGADWAKVGECEVDGGLAPGQGLFNKVTMEGDSDGEENNEACNPLTTDPEFAVKKESAEAGATAADGEWTSAYTVTVTNTGRIDGTSAAVLDTPSVPEGFTVTGATVDGEEVSLEEGQFLVTDGAKLATGKSETFEVVISGTYEAAEADWAAAAECDIEGEGDPSKGFFNRVTMEGDSDGPENNYACNTVEMDPSFAVKKEASGAELTDDGFVSKYEVTVTNTGEVTGKSAQVTDTTDFAEGFTPETALVDGDEVDLKDGSFTVTDGVELKPGDSKTFEIEIRGVIAEGADWAKVGECEVDGGLAPGQGLFNKVTMEGDSDGEENNEACNPLTTDPEFAVKKESAEAGATAADGEWTSAYTVTVTNTGRIDGTSAAVLDTPSVPEGFTVTGATVDGEEVSLEEGQFLVTDGAKLATGKSKTFEVVISGTYEAAEADWAAAAECDIEGEGDPSKGFFNRVTMNGDSDGPENNYACNTVEMDPSFAVKKEASGAELTDDGFVSKYEVTVTNTGDVAGTSAEVVDTPGFAEGFTAETALVDGEEVSFKDGSFTVTDGVELEPGKTKVFEIAIHGTIAEDADWAKVGECEVEDGLAAGQGLFNKVTMEGDSDGDENNEDCNPLERDPSFAVKKEAAGAQLTDDGFVSKYEVTVTNTGDVAGTSAEVVDTPGFAEGFTAETALVDGDEVAIRDGKFIVTDGVELEPGKTKVFEVEIHGVVAEDADWAKVGECEVEDGLAAGQGLFNKVTMEGDSDGEKNNEDCNPLERDPAFAVKKEASGAELTDDGFVSKYEVTVTNTGDVKGTSAEVVDTPGFAEGFIAETALVDGDEVAVKDGSFIVTDGVELEPGKTKVFEIEIHGVIAEDADWAKVGECEVDEGLAAGQGLFNKVTMEGDSDGDENNEDCNPLERDPSFAVKKDSAEAGATAADGEWTSAYTVTVTNTGDVDGTSAAVLDTPSVPEGFTVTGATVDGEDVSLEEGQFLVTDGAKLEVGDSVEYSVIVSGTYDAANADWATAGECDIEGEGDPSKGFFNRVTMNGDSDGPENNDACNTVEMDPGFAVKKEASGAELTDDGFVSKYEVTVTNTGDVKGTSAEVVDTPGFAEGFIAETALVDGDEVAVKDGSFIVTDGVELEPGKTKVFEIEIHGVIAEGADWAKVGECEVDEGLAAGQGLFNKVTMDGDSDGEENNEDCNPLERDPAFAVKKDSAEAGATAADGEWSSAYTVTVTNTGDVSGTSAEVVDIPSVPAGFTITGATVNGDKVEIEDGKFIVTEGVELDVDKNTTFEVVLSGTYEASEADWVAAAECEIEGEGDPSKGFFNRVTMKGDSDGPENNDACNTVEMDPGFAVKKDAAGATAEDGEWTSNYVVTVTNTGELAGTSAAVLDEPTVPAGFNWTGATVDGEEVTVEDGKFTVTEGTELAAGSSTTFTVVLTGTYDANEADWAAAGECDVEGEGDPSKGFFNRVTMEGDSDGPENNDACNTVEPKEPQFAVQKDKNAAAASISVDPRTWSADYIVTVSNTGEVNGTSAAVVDTPTVPAGFTITGASVDGKDVTFSDGSFTVTAGVELKTGETASFEVKVTGTYDADSADWTAAGECEIEGAGNPSKGFFNRVTMEGDSDGPENNDACVPGFQPDEPSIAVIKKLNGYDAPQDAPVYVEPGSDINATFIVTNTGNTVLNNVTVTDDVISADQIQAPKTKYAADGSEVGAFDGSLEPGEYAVFSASFTAPKAGGTHRNVAVAEGEVPPKDPEDPENPDEPEEPGETPPTVTSPPDDGNLQVPALSIVKYINGDDANEAPGVEVQPGDDMLVTYKVTNTGPVDLSDISITDVITEGDVGEIDPDTISCPSFTLKAGEEMECSTIIPAPEGWDEQHTNVAYATGTPPANPEVPPAKPGEPKAPATPNEPTKSNEDPGNAHTPKKPKDETPPPEERTPPGETPPEETPPVETPPEDTPPGETPPEETPPEDTPPGETPPVDTPPEETPPADAPKSPLARTGAQIGLAALVAAGLLAAGGAALMAARRRKNS